MSSAPIMLSTLESLPTELLDRIVDLTAPPFHDRSDQAYKQCIGTFRAISQTSRTLSPVGQSHLYRFIRTPELGGKIQLLLRTLSSSPQLADMVKELLVRPSRGSSPCMPLDRLEICWEATERNFGVGVRTTMANATFNPRRSCRTWEIVMLAALTNRIRTLVHYFDPPYEVEMEQCRKCPDMTQILESMLSTPSTQVTKYTNLSDVRIVGNSQRDRGPAFKSALAPVMQRPKVTNLVGTAIRSEFEHNASVNQPSASSISRLSLRKCLLNGRDISRLITGCRALDKVSISWSRGLGHAVDPCALLAAVQQHHSSLKTLTFRGSTTTAAPISPMNQSRVFAHGLSNFACLTSLTIDETLLSYGAHCTTDDGHIELALNLPASLTSLTMRSPQDLRALPTILRAVCSSIPEHLKHFKIMFRPNEYYDLRMCLSPTKRPRPGGPLQWTINRSSEQSAQGVRLVRFHCWKKYHPLATSMKDIIQLADSGGIEKVVDYLRVRDPENPCRCIVCSPYLPYPLVPRMGFIPIPAFQTN
ncbi:hypothetical protein CKM354_000449900 [Cercospora kikuchii]|uniref:Uncharacterized protein n=1 Tax=Cercospora kikuchii TaxID=84275 RepID=A0A9P3CBJ4_9PEZI|nr:uncharacterized protein CKM354_000449900 [Cercospora kikuchii]GIZ41184.1 hypothetical protein CKM354_000449900 [Cercospora kikuchii]